MADSNEPTEQAGEHTFKPPWGWYALPMVDLDAPRGRSFEIEQISGRKIWLTQLHQYGTDGGRMAGIPQACDRYIESALKMAVTFCGEGEKAPVVLPPRLIRLPIHTHPSMQEFLDAGRPQAQLPGITSIGKFYSDSIAEEALVSIAVVIWYQDAFGLPTDEHVLAQLRELDWLAHAWDWEF